MELINGYRFKEGWRAWGYAREGQDVDPLRGRRMFASRAPMKALQGEAVLDVLNDEDWAMCWKP